LSMDAIAGAPDVAIREMIASDELGA
jgi:hypothetical protein